jgi:aspartyl-tRNA(Asn)/glutamyl-tRNA(Gln) amidotransferase subunit A
MTDSPATGSHDRGDIGADALARMAIERVKALPPSVADTIFVSLDEPRILAEADAMDRRGAKQSLPLAGLLVSIKDLFDEAGLVTRAGSTVLSENAPATQDALAVQRLRAAGAVGFGRTTMSEFAYSGVGLNPHFGNPGNALDPDRIAGGSTSGGALSVALGIADAALGSDTGGSVRIPAALNGLCGFKPTQSLVPLDGAFPLSPSYDSVGPIARSIAICRAVHSVLSAALPEAGPASAPRIGIVQDMLEGMDDQVADDFACLCARLAHAGFDIEDVKLTELEGYGAVNRILVAREAHAIHAHRLARLKADGDQRVLQRILAAADMSDNDEKEARAKRAAAIDAFAARSSDFDAFLAPTVPTLAPLTPDVEANFDRLNGLMLKNPSAVNFLDGCAATVPMHADGALATGAMIFAAGGADWQVLSLAERIETLPRR